MESKSDLIQQRYEKLTSITEQGHDSYPHKYSLSHSIPQIAQDFSDKSAEELEEQRTSVQTAGRLMTLRRHGKAGFAHLFGEGGSIQIYVRQDRVGEENYQLFRLLDIGDFIGVEGDVLRTKTGELTIFADRIDFLAKSLQPLPEKWHGLSDVEIRYRQRYLDLLVNSKVRQIFVDRSRVIAEMRRFFGARGYLEVETPMMHSIAGGATARPFKTHHEALDMELFLRIAPELYLKRLIVGGFERVYEINRSFRNEGVSTQHNPEFTMLEFYQAYSDFWDLMDLTEELFQEVVKRVCGGLEVEFSGDKINFQKFDRYSMIEAIQKFWEGPSPSQDELCDRDRVKSLLKELHLDFQESDGWGLMLATLFDHVVEEQLVQPTFIYHLPAELSPLSKTSDEDHRFAERFELFVGGLELANAYSEQNDPEEQRKRFKEQLEARVQGDEEAHVMDDDYIRALCYGMPPTAGEGIGVDRLTMVLTNSNSIREVILFPHLRSEA